MAVSYWIWGGFTLFILALLILDLGVFHRQAKVISIKEALWASLFWVILALAFNALIYSWKGRQPALEFLTGYLIERSLSTDNLFVFLLIFNYFAVPPSQQHRVLFWGILGALLFRFLFIIAGVALIQRFYWTVYLFGAILLYTGIKMAFKQEKEIHPEKNPVLNLFRRFIPTSSHYEEGHFFVKKGGQTYATPLFVALLIVETTDIVFAVDSIPAILAITRDPFIVWTSNVFAIFGLRALYFALAGMMEIFHYLHYGLSIVLVWVGIKMLLSHYYKIPTSVSLIFIGIVLLFSILLSLLHRKKEKGLANPLPPVNPQKEE